VAIGVGQVRLHDQPVAVLHQRGLRPFRAELIPRINSETPFIP
jgi:hypothetical protein